LNKAKEKEREEKKRVSQSLEEKINAFQRFTFAVFSLIKGVSCYL